MIPRVTHTHTFGARTLVIYIDVWKNDLGTHRGFASESTMTRSPVCTNAGSTLLTVVTPAEYLGPCSLRRRGFGRLDSVDLV